MSSVREASAAELAEIRRHGLYRRVRDVTGGAEAPLVDGRPLRIFGSNDYLGLAGHPEVRAAAAAAAAEWGAGSGGSRVTTGGRSIHRELERELADWKGTEDALLFPSGYQAAVGTIPALVGRGDLIVSDQRNHACLIDGCRLSRAEVRIFRHADVGHARELLADRGRFRRALLVTDGVFSMDGDLAPLHELAALCAEHDAWLMVDDAHGTGVLGPAGRGTASRLGVSGAVDVQMGTLSKALGSQGGFIAGCGELIDLLRNRARSFLFTTAPAPAASAGALAAVRVARRGDHLRTQLARNVEGLRQGLRTLGFVIPDDPTPIIPVVLGTAGAAMRAAEELECRGIWAPAIRPPTVPEGTARLRVSLSAAHTDEDVSAALTGFRELFALREAS